MLLGGVARAADTVSSTTIRNSGGAWGGNYAFLFGNASDGTGESAVVKVSTTALQGTPSRLQITKLKWAVRGMSVSVLYDATTDDRVAILTGNGELSEEELPLKDPRSAGATGNVLFTTHLSSDTARAGYTIYMELKRVD